MSSVKNFFLLLFLLLLILVPSSADPGILLDEHGLNILIEEIVQGENDVRLTLKCENTEPYDREITLADLSVGEMPGSFRYGWGTEFFRLGSDETILYELNIETDDLSISTDKISFRILEGGSVSSPAEIVFSENGYRIIGASFEAGQEEPQILDPRISLNTPAYSLIRLTDRPGPEVSGNVDEAFLRIAVLTETDDGEQYMPVTTVLASVDPEGVTAADYSGLTVIFLENPEIPVQIEEKDRDGKHILAVSGISLTGEAIYYADLSFEICVDDKAFEICSYHVMSDEMGGEYAPVPAALFDRARISLQLFRMEDFGSGSVPVESGSVSGRCDITGTLSPQIIPAVEIGSLYAWFEYCMTDGSIRIRGPFPL